MSRERLSWLVPALLALLSLLASGFVGYAHNDKEVSNRVTAIETKQADDRDRLERIERKVDQVLENQRSLIKTQGR